MNSLVSKSSDNDTIISDKNNFPYKIGLATDESEIISAYTSLIDEPNIIFPITTHDKLRELYTSGKVHALLCHNSVIKDFEKEIKDFGNTHSSLVDKKNNKIIRHWLPESKHYTETFDTGKNSIRLVKEYYVQVVNFVIENTGDKLERNNEVIRKKNTPILDITKLTYTDEKTYEVPIFDPMLDITKLTYTDNKYYLKRFYPTEHMHSDPKLFKIQETLIGTSLRIASQRLPLSFSKLAVQISSNWNNVDMRNTFISKFLKSTLNYALFQTFTLLQNEQKSSICNSSSTIEIHNWIESHRDKCLGYWNSFLTKEALDSLITIGNTQDNNIQLLHSLQYALDIMSFLVIHPIYSNMRFSRDGWTGEDTHIKARRLVSKVITYNFNEEDENRLKGLNLCQVVPGYGEYDEVIAIKDTIKLNH